MCGIVGVFGNIIKRHENAFQQLLVVDQLRGQDSTGMIRVPRFNTPVETQKAVGTPDMLMHSKVHEKIMSGVHRALIGHNRAATKGAVNRNNAHPFEFEHIVGVHNGSLRSYVQLDGYGDHQVDSHVLYQHINNKGLRDMVDKCEGAMSLVWWDKRSDELNFYRNSERPMFLAYSSKDGVLMFGSEYGMLDWIADRNGILLESIEETPKDMHLRFSLPASATKFEKPVAEVVTKVVKTFFPKVVVTNVVKPEEGKTQATTKMVTSPSEKEHISVELGNMKVERNYYEIQREFTMNNTKGFLLSSDDYPGLRFFMVSTTNTRDFAVGDLIETVCSGHVRQGVSVFYFLSQLEMIHIPAAGTVDYAAADAAPLVEDCEEGWQTDPAAFRNPSGRPMEAKEWYKYYGFCSYCNGDNDPASCTAVRDLSGFLCDDCAKDTAVALNLV